MTSEFPPQPGGIGNHAYHLALQLQQNGYEVTVLADMRSKDGIEEDTFDMNLPIKVVRVKRYRLLLRTYLRRMQLARRLIRSHTILLFSGKFSLFALNWLYSSNLQRKWFAIIHGSELLLPNRKQRSWVHSALEKADAVIAVSNYTASLVKLMNLKALHIIPNGFDNGGRIETFKTHYGDTIKLITVGNVTERKGQHNVVKALPELLKTYPDLEYHLVGLPTEKDSLVALANSLNVGNRLHFHGRVSDEEKVSLLRDSSIFIMLSERTLKGDVEGFGIAILEANAMGIPAIGSQGTGIEDAISSGVSGALVDANDPIAIRNAITTIEGAYKMYSEGAVTWSRHFTWDVIIQRYLEVINGKQED